RCRCFKAKGNRTIELNHRLRKYRQKAKEQLCSEEGLKHRGQRCIEPEAVFGQMKNNMNYKRFRHFGKDKVFMDFAFFAIAFNIKKICAKMAKEGMDWKPIFIVNEKKKAHRVLRHTFFLLEFSVNLQQVVKIS
uniref:transposase n=1 Tax=Parabacteroides merdae TaxID=46503 RepID=UPI0022E20EFE